jgi:hypothetical protein
MSDTYAIRTDRLRPGDVIVEREHTFTRRTEVVILPAPVTINYGPLTVDVFEVSGFDNAHGTDRKVRFVAPGSRLWSVAR